MSGSLCFSFSMCCAAGTGQLPRLSLCSPQAVFPGLDGPIKALDLGLVVRLTCWWPEPVVEELQGGLTPAFTLPGWGSAGKKGSEWLVEEGKGWLGWAAGFHHKCLAKKHPRCKVLRNCLLQRNLMNIWAVIPPLLLHSITVIVQHK